MTELEKLKLTLNVSMTDEAESYRAGWNACIDHLAAQGRIVPDGWVAVPKEPTTEMTNKVVRFFTCNSKNLATDAYKAMLAAAPKPFESEEE